MSALSREAYREPIFERPVFRGERHYCSHRSICQHTYSEQTSGILHSVLEKSGTVSGSRVSNQKRKAECIGSARHLFIPGVRPEKCSIHNNSPHLGRLRWHIVYMYIVLYNEVEAYKTLPVIRNFPVASRVLQSTLSLYTDLYIFAAHYTIPYYYTYTIIVVYMYMVCFRRMKYDDGMLRNVLIWTYISIYM